MDVTVNKAALEGDERYWQPLLHIIQIIVLDYGVHIDKCCIACIVVSRVNTFCCCALLASVAISAFLQIPNRLTVFGSKCRLTLKVTPDSPRTSLKSEATHSLMTPEDTCATKCHQGVDCEVQFWKEKGNKYNPTSINVNQKKMN